MIRTLFAVCLLLIFSVTLITAQEVTPEATEIVRLRPPTVAVATNGGLTLARLFPSLLQGQVGLLHLTGENIQEGRVLFRNREYRFFDSNEDGWYAFIVADIDAQPRNYPISIIVRKTDGTTLNFADTITIESSGYIRQLFEVPSNLGYLIDPAVERNEYARLDSLVDTFTPQSYWSDSVWSLPISSAYSSSFGQYRILNEAVQTRHTGWDQSAPTGTPVGAMADGVVVFANQLDIRGNYILIDHGRGVFTGYAHMSEMNVQQGQAVTQGQIIGASGNTGRSNGPHLHWEIVVNGEWVDGVLFLEMWLP